jgi:hypothetical protein
VTADGTFLVEDFLGAIASQLDKTQDALAYKTINRPLTYAIREFTMELKVFVELDAEGKVRFRSSGPNEAGASVVHLGFTTITRPQIEENTASLALTRAPTLAEAGLSDTEQRRLEQLGVRTTSELARLQNRTGTDGIARLSDVPLDRLRAALVFGRPSVKNVRPVPPAPPPPRTPPPPRATPPPPRPLPPRPEPRPKLPPIRMPTGTKRLEVTGRNMLGAGGPPQLRLDGRELAVTDADDGRIVVELPDGPVAGTLEIDHGNGDVAAYELATDDPWVPGEAA